jgi:hypothetical protein
METFENTSAETPEPKFQSHITFTVKQLEGTVTPMELL